ncbi:uncharacterized protein [Watersipora subatra]|uniref:uncharacterized protein n=1 Tax=Watersipora subatra TaxID=2589382 RepID=UPI00355C200F
MRVRRRKSSPKHSSAPQQQSSTSGSDFELAPAGKAPRRKGRRRCAQVEDEQVYDADGEQSSGTESKRIRKKVKESVWKHVEDDGVFSFDEMDDVESIEHNHRPKIRLSKKTSSTEKFKVPSLPKATPSNTFYSSLKKEKKNDSPNAQLRVSFSDDSFNHLVRYERRSSKEDNDRHRVVETSTPANTSLTGSASKVLRVSLPRLSSLASPILMDTSNVMRSRRGQLKDLQESMSSGYESLLKSNNSMQDSTSSQALKRPVYELPESDTEVPKSPPKSLRKQRKIAIEKMKKREDRYLEEMNELDDYQLYVE